MAAVNRSNIPNVNLVEQVIRAFAARNRLEVEGLRGKYSFEFPDWKLLRLGDGRRKSVLIRPGANTRTIGLFVTPLDANIAVATRAGGTLYIDIAGYLRTALELELRSACGALGWASQ